MPSSWLPIQRSRDEKKRVLIPFIPPPRGVGLSSPSRIKVPSEGKMSEEENRSGG